MLEVPLHPEYPCAHCNSAAAFGTVVVGLAGPGRPVILRSEARPRREYATAAALAAEVMNARVWAGIHFRNSAETGADLGKRLGEYALTQMRPVP